MGLGDSSKITAFDGNNKDFQLDNCSICERPFSSGQKYYLDNWGAQFHDYHLKELDFCYSCNRPIHPNVVSNHPHESGGYRFDDGRYACNSCISDDGLVILDTQGEEILREVIVMGKRMGLEIPNIFNIKLVTKNELNSIRRQELREGEKNPALTQLSITKRLLQKGAYSLETKCDIYILRGLSTTFFKSCLAHELMHVWLFANAQYDQESSLNEGLCNYYSYKILEADHEIPNRYKKYHMKIIEEDPSIDYGEGFRRVKLLSEKLEGLENILIFAKYNSKLP